MPFLVFLTALITLALEVFDTRLFSVVLWPNVAFAVISLALLGLGTSGLVVYLFPRFFSRDRLVLFLSWLTPLFGLAVLLCYVWTLKIARLTYTPEADGVTWNYLGVAVIALLPFFFAGLILTLAFTYASQNISRLYFLDLLGAAIGAAIVLPLLQNLNGPPIIPVLSASLAAAGVFYALINRRPLPAAASVLILALAVSAPADWMLGEQLDVIWAKGRYERQVFLEQWGPEARITAHGNIASDSVILKMDGGVVTPVLRFSGNFDHVRYLRHNVLQLAYHVRPYGSAIVIGPGGGSDVLSAVLFGVPDVTAVEVNRATVGLMLREPLRSFSGGLYEREGVRVRIADGRTFVSAFPGQVDLIQATFIDTYAASSAGSHTLSENYVYTVDAFEDYLDHLEADGILSVSRWGWQPEADRQMGPTVANRSSYVETLKVVSTAYQVLASRGIENPQNHIIVVQGPEDRDLALGGGYQHWGGDMDAMVTTLIKKSAFTSAEIERVRSVSRDNHFRPLWYPGIRGPESNVGGLLGARASSKFIDKYYEDNALDITPTSDDRPFFFVAVNPQDYFSMRARPIWKTTEMHRSYHGVRALFQVFTATAILVAVLLLLPLMFRVRDLEASRRTVLILGYFTALGLGFIGVELGFIHRLSLFLGHPIYALVIVLVAILLFSSLGSLSTGRITGDTAVSAWRTVAMLVPILALLAFLLPMMVRVWIGWAFWAKVVASVMVVFPPAFLMGRLFPLGIKAIQNTKGNLIPWVWGINSGFSVLGAVLSMLIAVGWGFTASWWLFAAVYLMGGLCMRQLKDVLA